MPQSAAHKHKRANRPKARAAAIEKGQTGLVAQANGGSHFQLLVFRFKLFVVSLFSASRKPVLNQSCGRGKKTVARAKLQPQTPPDPTDKSQEQQRDAPWRARKGLARQWGNEAPFKPSTLNMLVGAGG